MNSTQLEAFARQVLPILGTLMTVLGIKSATANAIIDLLMAIIGPLMTIASVVWMFISNTKSNIIAKAANLDEVKDIKLTPQAPNTLVASTPDNVTK